MTLFRLPFRSGYALEGRVEGERLGMLRLVSGALSHPDPRPVPEWWGTFVEAVEGYRQGLPVDFRFVPLVWERLTPYARKVLQVLQTRVGWGERITYGELARIAGGSPRSVGQVMRRNPWVIVVPCHRVCGSRGLGGYVYGAGVKQMLLNLERGVVPLEPGGYP